MTKHVLLAMILTLAAAAMAAGPSSAPATSSSPASAAGSQPGTIKLDHLRIDRKNRTVTIDAVVCYSPAAMEVFLCREGTKDYESVLSTKALPSHIHAGLLMLGLTPGVPVSVCKGCESHPIHMIPPQGPRVTVTVRWNDANGLPHQAPAADWLTSARDPNKAPPKEWVFVGSDVLPNGAYWADGDGDIICTSNFASAVIDVPFPSTADNSMLEIAGNEKAIPPKETAVEVVIAPVPGAQKDPVGRVTIEIDATGQFWIEGKPHTLDALMGWAEQFNEKHSNGYVVLRARPGAAAYLIELARGNLRLGGIENFTEELLLPHGEPTPRTAAQAKELLEDWQRRLAKPNAIMDPFIDAQAHLQQVQQELDEMQRVQSLLGEYSQQLKHDLAKAQAATRPAKP